MLFPNNKLLNKVMSSPGDRKKFTVTIKRDRIEPPEEEKAAPIPPQPESKGTPISISLGPPQVCFCFLLLKNVHATTHKNRIP